MVKILAKTSWRVEQYIGVIFVVCSGHMVLMKSYFFSILIIPIKNILAANIKHKWKQQQQYRERRTKRQICWESEKLRKKGRQIYKVINRVTETLAHGFFISQFHSIYRALDTVYWCYVVPCPEGLHRRPVGQVRQPMRSDHLVLHLSELTIHPGGTDVGLFFYLQQQKY